MEISSKTSKEVLQESVDLLSYIFNRDSGECKHSIFQGTCCFGMDKLMGSFCLLNSTTASSISMEKRTINIIKSLPIKRSTLYLSKIMVNMTVSIPFIILNATLLNYYLNPNNYIKTMMYVTPILYQLNISMLGLYLNLKYPSYEYKSDVQIIKQSIPAIFTLIIGVFMAVSPFSNMKVKIPSNFFVWIHTTRIIFYNLILFLCLLFNKSYKKDD